MSFRVKKEKEKETKKREKKVGTKKKKKGIKSNKDDVLSRLDELDSISRGESRAIEETLMSGIIRSTTEENHEKMVDEKSEINVIKEEIEKLKEIRQKHSDRGYHEEAIEISKEIITLAFSYNLKTIIDDEQQFLTQMEMKVNQILEKPKIDEKEDILQEIEDKNSKEEFLIEERKRFEEEKQKFTEENERLKQEKQKFEEEKESFMWEKKMMEEVKSFEREKRESEVKSEVPLKVMMIDEQERINLEEEKLNLAKLREKLEQESQGIDLEKKALQQEKLKVDEEKRRLIKEMEKLEEEMEAFKWERQMLEEVKKFEREKKEKE